MVGLVIVVYTDSLNNVVFLQEEVAASLTRLLTTATGENKIKKWWQFWKQQAVRPQK